MGWVLGKVAAVAGVSFAMNMGLVGTEMYRRQLRDEEDDARDNKRVRRSAASSGAIVPAGKGEEVVEGVESIYRSVPDKVIHCRYPFMLTEYATIDTGLSYFPIQHSLSSLLSKEFEKWCSNIMSNRSFKMAIIKFKEMKVRNPIVLSDQIQVTSSGSTEVSSFVQNAKILHYRLGGANCAAHAYSFKHGTSVGQMNSKDIIGGHKALSEGILTAKFGNLGELADIKIAPLKLREFTTECDEVMPENVNVKIPFQYGYVRPSTETNPNPPLKYLKEDQLAVPNLINQAHSYLNSGEELDIELPADAYFCSAERFKEFVTRETMQTKHGNTYVPLFSTNTGYLSRSQGDTDGTTYIVTEKAFEKANAKWQLHDYMTMIPIKTTGGAVMKIRASVEVNFTFELHLVFTPNSTTFDLYDQFNVVGGGLPFAPPLQECFGNNSSNFNVIMKH